MKITSSIYTTALLLGSLFTPTLAQAGHVDAKTTPGLACQETVGSQASDFSRDSPYIQNNANSLRTVVCPIVRDNTTNTNGTAAAYTDVRIYNAGGTLWCYLDSSNAAGSLTNWDYRSTVVNPGILQNDLKVSQVNGYYNLYCGLPPKSRINGYRIGEYTATDANN